ncbi:hypothetical protein [Lactobacillus helveticus]|uniref:hypothetical protein n=1 Tax=Lactobacillus helveticus TaxID=1587 RepID=UPI0021822B21|nr:hypothetical protein [Lactobacillus helveticus]
MASSPVMTTVFTTVSGMGDIRYALVLLLAVEATVLLVAVRMSIKVKKTEKGVNSTVAVND